MTMRKSLHLDLACMVMHADEKDIFNAEDTSEKAMNNMQAFIVSIYLLCKEDIVEHILNDSKGKLMLLNYNHHLFLPYI